ncbi:MAG: hypothetical protein V4760_13955 [Bdellovibrionota bacterium]
MLRLVRASISKLVFIGIAALVLQGCTTATEKLDHRLKVGEPMSRVYYAKYEEVESAIKQAMIKYPQRVDNTEDGIFETDYVKGEARFRPPQNNEAFSPGYRYRILIRLVKGKATEKPAVKVLVTKQIEIARDFFAQPQPVASDGLEENVVLYRIGREITVARALVKANDKANQVKENSGI